MPAPRSPPRRILELLPSLLARLRLGALARIGGAWVLALLIDRIDLPCGLDPPFALAGGDRAVAATQLAAGSGFLAFYLCGVMLRGLPASTGPAHRSLSRRARLSGTDRDAGDARTCW